MTDPTFPPFFFDGNRYAKTIDTEEGWWELVAAYEGDVDRLLAAKNAPLSDVVGLPSHYHLHAPDVQTGAMETFGFRREHHGGTLTLGTWARARGFDLAASAARRPRA